jgi:hypothetical protein
MMTPFERMSLAGDGLLKPQAPLPSSSLNAFTA